MPPVPPTPPEEIDVGVEIDDEWFQVRTWRREQLEAAGIADFAAFRLAMAVDVDLHRLVAAKAHGATDDMLIDLFID